MDAKDFFEPHEYIMGDSAFEPSTYLIPAFKKPHGHVLPQEYENFNKHLSSARVISEHTIGIWKARFPWLRNIPLLLTENPRTTRRVLQLIECSVILHNFLIMEKEGEVPSEWLDNDDICPPDEHDREVNRPLSPDAAKNEKQMMYMTYINNKLY
jgi:hypothetical protein